MAAVPGVGVFHLWPVTKFQFEQFMWETNRYGDKWYDSILSLNKRISYRFFSETDYERLFITGILPEEAMDFARWMGEGFDLPSAAEWEKFYQFMNNRKGLCLPLHLDLSPPASAVKQKAGKFLHTPLAFSFLQGGVVEWLKESSRFAGRGAPRSSFFPNAWNPLEDSIRVIDINERIFYFGFRLIRRLTPQKGVNAPY